VNNKKKKNIQDKTIRFTLIRHIREKCNNQ